MQAMASGREESDYDSSCSSFTAPDSRRSWISDASLACSSTLSVRSSGDAAAHKPHKATQAEWEAIRSLRASAPGGHVGLDHFRLVRRLGSGDLGNVYLCRLRSPSPSPSPLLFAMKVVDRDALAFKKKLQRAETEREILRSLDHPFLPTLYAEFDASRYSCFVMEFCPGGDLHAARQRLPARRFSLPSAKFYAAETILAIEYLHMMGVVYRDLKPENVLVRDDGHIMLSDFDLSLKCDVVPKLLKQRLAAASSGKSSSSSSSSSGSCVPPMQHCFSRSGSKKSKPRPSAETGDNDDDQEGAQETELVAEPISARSKSFVGTHEYLAPEVISGAGHGSAVDWWTLGVFLYEMMYGRTPFKGEDNERTLTNIVKQPLSFPRLPAAVSAREAEEVARAQDLVGKLLVKNPKRRMGCVRGSVEIKRHEFFRGVNWALIRSVRPPEVPRDLRRVKCRAAAAVAVAALPVQRLSRKQREEPFKMHQRFDYF